MIPATVCISSWSVMVLCSRFPASARRAMSSRVPYRVGPMSAYIRKESKDCHRHRAWISESVQPAALREVAKYDRNECGENCFASAVDIWSCRSCRGEGRRSHCLRWQGWASLVLPLRCPVPFLRAPRLDAPGRLLRSGAHLHGAPRHYAWGSLPRKGVGHVEPVVCREGGDDRRQRRL